jgi:hypothetical protein
MITAAEEMQRRQAMDHVDSVLARNCDCTPCIAIKMLVRQRDEARARPVEASTKERDRCWSIVVDKMTREFGMGNASAERVARAIGEALGVVAASGGEGTT